MSVYCVESCSHTGLTHPQSLRGLVVKLHPESGIQGGQTLLSALVYMILWFDHSVMDVVVNVVMFCLVIISDATNEFLPRADTDVLY